MEEWKVTTNVRAAERNLRMNVSKLQEYRMKARFEAVQIDHNWLAFLIREKKFDKANIGDYYYIGIDGTEDVMKKENFERLFELAA
jgi:hypothetical protein